MNTGRPLRLTGKKIHPKLTNDREQMEGSVMCTSIVVNKNKTIVGWNLDLLDMEYRVSPADETRNNGETTDREEGNNE